MGSETESNQRRAERVLALMGRSNLTPLQKAFLDASPRPRHRCRGCGNGGHARRAPTFRVDDGSWVKYGFRA